MERSVRRLIVAVGLAGLGLAGPFAGAQVPDPSGSRLDRAALEKAVADLLAGQGEGIAAGLWLGGAGGPPLFERDSAVSRPTASAIKSFYLVELFAAHRGALDGPLPGALAILEDDAHPAISHFSPEVRDEIRRELGGASVRRVGEVMTGRAKASNAVYNAAANLVTAVLGGPEALTALIRRRDPAFRDVHVRRYMLRDRTRPGDNEAPAAALAALYGKLATRRLDGVDAPTMEAVREALSQEGGGGKPGSHFAKAGSLATDPLTEVRAGWRETAGGPLIYVVMALQKAPGPDGRLPSSERLARTANALVDVLTRAGQTARK